MDVSSQMRTEESKIFGNGVVVWGIGQDACDGCGEGGLGQLVERKVVCQLDDKGGRVGGLSLQQMVVVQLEVGWWTGGIEDRIVV
jgi:hypothetical protein